jgi:hypothetical protein
MSFLSRKFIPCMEDVAGAAYITAAGPPATRNSFLVVLLTSGPATQVADQAPSLTISALAHVPAMAAK